MSVTVTPVLALLACVAYAGFHRGKDWPGIVLGALLGGAITAAGGPFAAMINQANDVIAGVLVAIVEAIGHALGGGATKAAGLAAVRYNLALVGIGR